MEFFLSSDLCIDMSVNRSMQNVVPKLKRFFIRIGCRYLLAFLSYVAKTVYTQNSYDLSKISEKKLFLLKNIAINEIPL